MDNRDCSGEKLDAADINLTKNNKFFTWLDNFWYHHKWKVIIITFFAIIAVVGIVQMTGKADYDINITVATHTIYYRENVAALESDLESLMPADRNKDGERSILLKTYKIYSESELKEANEAETDEDKNPIIYADEVYNKNQMQEYTSYIRTGDCTVMILSEYLYGELVSKREEDILLVPMSELFGEELPVGTVSNGYGVRLRDTEAYKYFDSFKTIPDDAVICIMRPFVVGVGADKEKYDFATDYFKSIVTFGE